MEVKGKIIQKLPPLSGTSKSTGKAWNKQEYVLETIGDAYPKQIFFDFFGDRANQYSFEVGDTIVLSFDIESREYNGRWYTNIRGWKGEKVPATTDAPADASSAGQAPAPPAPDFSSTSPDDDLPF